MNPGTMTRRCLLGSVAGLALSLTRAAAAPNDRGIGGTGVVEPSDRGIGGTGVIGTIRKFGSIVVNDLRIAYPVDVPVVLDGRPGTAADLRIGHVVRVTADPRGTDFSTKMITVTSEVVGPVEKIGASRITVLGQEVSTTAHGRDHAWTQGEMVAVSGLRRPDGVIVASLIEAAPGSDPRVVGPVRRGANGQPAIGGLQLAGLAGSLDGQRVLVEGRAAPGGTFTVRQSSVETLGFGAGVTRLSVEAYAARGSDGPRLGSGLRVAGGRGDLPANGVTRVVLTGTPGADGRLDVTSLRRGGGGAVPAQAGMGPNGAQPRGRDAPNTQRGTPPADRGTAGSRPGGSGGSPGPLPTPQAPSPTPGAPPVATPSMPRAPSALPASPPGGGFGGFGGGPPRGGGRR